MGREALHEFILMHRDGILRRCCVPLAPTPSPPSSTLEIGRGLQLFLDQLVNALQSGLATTGEIATTAVLHGRARWLQGGTIAQVVQDFGEICQAIMDLAVEWNATISAEEFGALNRCLTDATAVAVSEYGQAQHGVRLNDGEAIERTRLRSLTYDIRNLTTAAMLAFDTLKADNEGVTGRSGVLLELSLRRIRDLVDRSLPAHSHASG